MIKNFFRKVMYYWRHDSLLQDWVIDLTLLEQSSLLSTLRGNDRMNGNCKESKNITKMLRFLIANDAGKKHSYMSDYVVHQSKVIGFLVKIYPENKHWVEHVLGAAYHIRNNHPNRYIREYWGTILSSSNNRINKWKGKERVRIEKERYVNRIISKYRDIYLNRYV